MKQIPQKLIKLVKQAPSDAGIYIWKDRQGSVLYIGKAINLRKRLSYYIKSFDKIENKTQKFLLQADKLEYIKVRNELEAILLEINLIRILKPKYNIISKDDKRPLLIHIDDGEFPTIKTARIKTDKGYYIGPFPNSRQLKQILRKIRSIFPYCSCKSNKIEHCLYVDLGLCNPSPIFLRKNKNKMSLQEYQKQKRRYLRNIRNIKYFLEGKIDYVIKIITKEMKEYSNNLNYEQAQVCKNQIDGIKSILSDKSSISEYLTTKNLAPHIAQSQIKTLSNILRMNKIFRIEGYDIANTGINNPTASMVVFENGFANSSKYRKFIIKGFDKPNDPAMIAQVITRRFVHTDWDYPDLILIDGGKTQLKSAILALKPYKLDIKIIGLMKKYEKVVIYEDNNFKILSLPFDSPALTLLKAIRDEAHRFTTTYHKFLREKQSLN